MLVSYKLIEDKLTWICKLLAINLYLVFFCNKNTIFFVNSLLFSIPYLFKFPITVLKMQLDSGKFSRKHAKYTVVLEKYSWLSADFFAGDNSYDPGLLSLRA